MKKLVVIFAIAVLVPSLTLGYLAMRAQRDQEIVVHSQRALLHQTATESLAADLNTFMDDVRVYYARLVDDLLKEQGDEYLSKNFDQVIQNRWGQAMVGCVVTDQGEISSPLPTTEDPVSREFLRYNTLFLSNRARAEVYSAPQPVGNFIAIEKVDARLPRDEEENEEAKPAPEAGSKLSRVSSATQDSPAPGSSNKRKADLPREEPAAGAIAPAENAAAPFKALADSSRKNSSGSRALKIKKEAPKQTVVAVSQSKMRSAEKWDYTALNNGQVQSGRLRQQITEFTPANAEEKKTERPKSDMAVQTDSEPAASLGGGGAATTAGSDGSILAAGQNSDSVQTTQGQPEMLSAPPINAPAAAPLLDADTQSRGIPAAKPRIVSPYAQIGSGGAGVGSDFQLFAEAATSALGNTVNSSPWSSLTVDNAPLAEIMGDQPEGAIARFLQDGLHVLLWVRNPAAPGKVFWAELDLTKIRARLAEIVTGAAFFQENSEEVSLALLDAEGDIVAQTAEGFTTDWRRPFVASEVGEILPHWEVAAYLIDPEAVAKSAATARMTLWLLVPILLAAIGMGSLIIFRDINREMFLARQKTDFVSNVSHELKTPLTSIRMFSDLLTGQKTIETEKRQEYSGVISREAARLTRLINNLLDFSRMDRGNPKFNLEPLDAVSLARETAENYRLQIEADGCELEFKNLNGEEIWIEGDRDALSQVLLNLLSNADKYACSGGEITVEIDTPNPGEIEWRVLDRGPGIRRRDAAKIFEKFYRADDSLATGIQGSGLGLTLARQIARGHGGDIRFHNREGGGSCFIVSLPVTRAE